MRGDAIELAEDLLRTVRRAPGRFRRVQDIQDRFDLDGPALDALAVRHFHCRPMALLTRARLEAATHRLQEGPVGDSELSDAFGWSEVTTTTRQLERHLGMSTATYGTLSEERRFTLRLPQGFRRQAVLAYLGRDPQSLYERVDGHCFRFAFRATSGAVVVSADIEPKEVRCRLEGPGRDAPEAAFTAHRLLRRYLGWIVDPQPFEAQAASQPLHRRLIGDRFGLSIPQTPSVFDGLVWVVAGQQVSLAVAFALRRRLGKICAAAVDHDLWLPPTAADVAALDHDTLRSCSWSQRKAEYVRDLARAVEMGELDLDDLRDASALRIESTLLARRGLGPWSVNYLMMRSFGLADCVPVGDAALKRNLRRFFDLGKAPNAEETLRLMEPFAPFRSLASFHFWAMDKTAQ